MVSALNSVYELLLSGKHDYDVFSLYQERTEICGMLIWAKGVQAAEIHTHLCAQYRDSALSWRNVYKWIEMCKKVFKIVTDAECVRHLSASARDENLEEARSLRIGELLSQKLNKN